MSATPRVVLTRRDLLGEGPVWDDSAGRLSWVDIKSRRVLTWAPDTGEPSVRSLPEETSLSLPTRDGRRVVAQVDRLVLDDGASLAPLCTIDPANEHTRLNDGCADDQGRLWVGTYSTRGEAEASVYCVSPDGAVTLVLDGLVAANGMEWTADGETLYVADTGRSRVDRFALDERDPGATTLVSRGALFVDGATEGRPDGLAVDGEGGVWVAMWGGASLRRYAPNGQLAQTVTMPVTYPTSLTFGGPDLATLFVTTSSHHLRGDDHEPLSGSLFAFEPDVPGLPTRRFGRGLRGDGSAVSSMSRL